MKDLKFYFLGYCTDYAYGKKRTEPLNQRTVGRYLRGLDLAEKLVGHSLDTVSNDDQIRFLEGIVKYKQGTRRVTLQIFQRFVHWGISGGHFTCDNLLLDKYDTIIGEHVQPTYAYIAPTAVNHFFAKITDDRARVIFGLMYYGGLTTAELSHVEAENVTPTGLFIKRGVSRKVDFVPLPRQLANTLYEYAENKQGPLLDVADSFNGRASVNTLYKQWQIDSGSMRGTTLRDLRTSGIRAFFNECNDLEMTKRFAGVTNDKQGWLESLLDVSAKDMEKINSARRFYGSSKKNGASE